MDDNSLDKNNPNEEDPYKEYYHANMFEGLKKSNPKVLTAVGIIAVIIIVLILLFAGPAFK